MWKRALRSHTREADSATWVERAGHVVSFEIRQLTPAAINAAARACEQPEFFGRAIPSIAAVASTPADHDLAREVGVAREADAQTAFVNAMCRAVATRVNAQVRETHIHVATEAPRDCRTLMGRMRESIAAVPVRELVLRALAGERLPIMRKAAPLDYEADIRPRV